MADAVNWQTLTSALRELHRTLVDVARSEYERSHLVTPGMGELLQLLTTDPEFEWLRGLSELMVDLDVLHDAPAPDQAEMATAVRGAVEHLLSNAQDPAGLFAQRYWPYLQKEPRVAMAHAAVKQALANWPPAQINTSTLLQERHRLAEKARHLTKRK
jgi:hypothetical protein